MTTWQRRAAASLLPDEVALDDWGHDDHPVIFLFGDQRRCAAMFGQVPIVAAPDYREMLIAVPHVRHRASPQPLIYLARGYSTSPLTVWNGNRFYGFAKQAARMWWQTSLFLVTDRDDSLLWYAQIDAADAGPTAADADWQLVRALFAAPVLGRTSTGSYVLSYFEWTLADAGEARQAKARIVRVSNGTPASPAAARTKAHRQARRDHSALEADCLAHDFEWASQPGGTLLVADMRWRLSWPTPL